MLPKPYCKNVADVGSVCVRQNDRRRRIGKTQNNRTTWLGIEGELFNQDFFYLLFSAEYALWFIKRGIYGKVYL